MFGGSRPTRSRRAVLGPILFAAVLVGAALPALSPFAQRAEAAECTIAVAGDIAKASGDAEATAKLVESLNPTAVLTTGDNAYDSGTAEEFQNYYEPTWGRFKNITKPSPGNHEYASGGDDYLAYFDVEPYYSFDVCGWHAVSLNSETDIDKQVEWLKTDLQQNAGMPLLAYWHAPRYSSSQHGSSDSVQPLWDAVAKAGAKLVFAGHDHVYERFAPMDGSGQATKNGTTQFTIGTGGAPSYDFGTPEENSEKRISNATGVGLFRLGATGYTFQFMQSDGTVGDKGSATFAASRSATTGTVGSKPTVQAQPRNSAANRTTTGPWARTSTGASVGSTRPNANTRSSAVQPSTGRGSQSGKQPSAVTPPWAKGALVQRSPAVTRGRRRPRRRTWI